MLCPERSPLRPQSQRCEEEIFKRGGLVEVEAQEAGVVLQFLDGTDDGAARDVVAGREARQRVDAGGLLNLGKEAGAEGQSG